MHFKPLLCVKIFLVFAAVSVLGLYFFHQTKAFLTGPQIIMQEPENGQVFENSFVLVKGKVVNTTSLLINGYTSLTDSYGNFGRKIVLAKGYNIIELLAKDKFGREIYKKLEVIVK